MRRTSVMSRRVVGTRLLGPRALGLLLLLAAPAFAQRLVVLELDGDADGSVRAQVESAVERAQPGAVVPLASFRRAAASRRLKGPAAFTGAAVARVSWRLRLDAAVGGRIEGSTYHVLIYDPSGQDLWTKALPLEAGRLTDELATRLARVILIAAERGATIPAAPEELDEATDVEPDDRGAEEEAPPTTAPGPPVTASAEVRVAGKAVETDAVAVAERAVPGPPWLRGQVTGTTTWRSQCLRPGVSRCADYASLSPKPPGTIVDFGAKVPYLGVLAELEVFPLAGCVASPAQRFFNGLGLGGSFAVGHSITRLVEETPQGSGPTKDLSSLELAWSLELLYRVHFRLGFGEPTPVGFVGLRGGVVAAAFDIDATAGTSLPSSRRLATLIVGFPAVGVEASLPLLSWLRIDARAAFFIAPRPAAEQVLAFGNPDDPTGGVQSSGFMLEGGFSGRLVGPLGWVLHVRHRAFVDRFFGKGQTWSNCTDACTGVGEESSTQLLWGVTGQY